MRRKTPVRPIITGPNWLEPGPIVGEARSLKEALRLVRSAGYRVMHIGGLHTLSPTSDELFITVYPSSKRRTA